MLKCVFHPSPTCGAGRPHCNVLTLSLQKPRKMYRKQLFHATFSLWILWAHRFQISHPKSKLKSFVKRRPCTPLKHTCMDASCVLEKQRNENHAYFHKSGGERLREKMNKLLKHIFISIYSEKNVSLAIRSLNCISSAVTNPSNPSIQHNFTNPTCIFFSFLVLLLLD